MGYQEANRPIDRVTTTTSTDDVKSYDVAPGDTALANAAFRFKMIALITALMLPGLYLFEKHTHLIYTHGCCTLVGSHFSGTALGAMKAELKSVCSILWNGMCVWGEMNEEKG